MIKDDKVTYGHLPYWAHNGHTATCTESIDQGDGSADVTMRCECGEMWCLATGLNDSEVSPKRMK